jgi:hypothetical protein
VKTLIFALILGFIWTALPARADLNYSPKFILKETNGLLLNEGTDPTLGGMQITYGGITLGYEHFLTPSVSAGAAYHVDFDYFDVRMLARVHIVRRCVSSTCIAVGCITDT